MSEIIQPPQVLGYEVVEPKMVGGIERFDKLSRRYIVESAAHAVCVLLKKQGHPTAYVRKIIGSEGPRGGKRFMKKVGSLHQ